MFKNIGRKLWVAQGKGIARERNGKGRCQVIAGVSFQYLTGVYKISGKQLFSWADNDRAMGNGFKLKGEI